MNALQYVLNKKASSPVDNTGRKYGVFNRDFEVENQGEIPPLNRSLAISLENQVSAVVGSFILLHTDGFPAITLPESSKDSVKDTVSKSVSTDHCRTNCSPITIPKKPIKSDIGFFTELKKVLDVKFTSDKQSVNEDCCEGKVNEAMDLDLRSNICIPDAGHGDEHLEDWYALDDTFNLKDGCKKTSYDSDSIVLNVPFSDDSTCAVSDGESSLSSDHVYFKRKKLSKMFNRVRKGLHYSRIAT